MMAYYMLWCIGFAWQGFGRGWPTGVASVRRCQKLPQCLTEPMPAGSKTDLPLAKAEPIGDSGSTSVITYFKRVKTAAQQQLGERSETV